MVETGNEALDTILTEKSLTCSSVGIVLSVIADGSALARMSAADIYSFFGNALDNAIEAVSRLADPEQNTISLTITRCGKMAAGNMENPYPTEPTFKDGLPQTTKADATNHGFGVRSMRATAERYGGTLHVGAEDGVFYLNALIPVE